MSQVVITGAAGNLGVKLITHLATLPHVSKIIGLDMQPPTPERSRHLQASHVAKKLEMVICDVGDGHDTRWRAAVSDADAVVHFAAQNPYPEASWTDANVSLRMTMNVALAAVDAGVIRFVFASSNHVMGRYKDEPLAGTVGPGQLTTDLEPGVGAIWHTGERLLDSTVYAVAKSSGEQVCRVMSERSEGRTSFVCIRVGWCQPGENLPTTLSAAGTPTQTIEPKNDDEWRRADQWFKQMWLSNRDFLQLFEKAVFADRSPWPSHCLVVNGMSDNSGMKWSLANARELIDYQPMDDRCRWIAENAPGARDLTR